MQGDLFNTTAASHIAGAQGLQGVRRDYSGQMLGQAVTVATLLVPQGQLESSRIKTGLKISFSSCRPG